MTPQTDPLTSKSLWAKCTFSVWKGYIWYLWTFLQNHLWPDVGARDLTSKAPFSCSQVKLSEVTNPEFWTMYVCERKLPEIHGVTLFIAFVALEFNVTPCVRCKMHLRRTSSSLWASCLLTHRRYLSTCFNDSDKGIYMVLNTFPFILFSIFVPQVH